VRKRWPCSAVNVVHELPRPGRHGGRNMMGDKDLLDQVLAALDSHHTVRRTKMFGKDCLKVHGKVMAVLWDGDVVFKLEGTEHAEALGLAGAGLWDPRGQGHAMREWVRVPATHAGRYDQFARAAYRYAEALAGR
jgi:TfoX/Sxy family transcriptional regulator of competence genes